MPCSKCGKRKLTRLQLQQIEREKLLKAQQRANAQPPK